MVGLAERSQGRFVDGGSTVEMAREHELSGRLTPELDRLDALGLLTGR